jgi:hypothetical protein
LRGMIQPIRGMQEARARVRTPSREVEERASDQQRKYCRSYEFHSFKPSGLRTNLRTNAEEDPI